MDFQAKCIQYLGETTGTSKAGNPWKKKEWVVETFGNYPRKVKVQCFGDRADLMNLEQGRDYVLHVDLESREFNGRWYTDVSVFRVDEYNAQAAQPGGNFGGGYQSPQPQQPSSPYPGNPMPGAGQGFVSDPSEEDLPF